jgi:hypothetical protein
MRSRDVVRIRELVDDDSKWMVETYAGCLHLVQQDQDGEQMRQVAYTYWLAH